jgi:hypothetical protein
MTPAEIKDAITKLAAEHASSGDEVDDWKDTDYMEQQAFGLITDYCRAMNYRIGEFPNKESEEKEYSDEHWMLYLDKLTLLHDDVAQLHWHWVVSFWPAEYERFEVFLDMIKARIHGGFYDVTLS